MALALYRKYRPRSFAEVIGQEHVTEPLIQALRAGRLNHAYLFSGPRGCGKTSSARILARSLNCAKGPTPDPCGDCESCRALAPDGPGSIDVIEIDAASHGGVDDARELRERAFFAPAISRYKIYIIDEAHMVSSAGFNALLKLVEEPPDYVKFVFATTEPEKVLGTIKSRTHHYPFRLIPPGALRPYLEQLCEAEGATVDPMVLPLVVRAGAGSVRDSLSVLDQLIAGAGPEGVTYARAVALLGVTDAGLIDDVCDALAASDAGVAFAAIERVVEAGHDPRRFTGDLLERLRDLILLRQVPDAAEKGLIDAPADQLERMKAQAGRIGPATLTRWAEIVHTGLVEMRGTASTRLLLELITARLLLPTVDASEIGVLSRLERLEQGIPAAAAWTAAPVERSTATERAAPAERSAPAEQRAPADRPMSAPPARVRQSVDSEPDDETPPWSETDAAAPASTVVPAAPGEIDAPAIRRTWDEIVQLTGRSNKRIAAMARDGVVRDVEGSTIVLVFKAAFHANSVGNDPGALLEAIHQVVGGTWQLRCEVGGDQRGPSAGRPPSGGGRSPAGKAEGSPPPIRSASPAPATTPTPMQRSTAFATDDWPETAPIGAAASAADTPEAVRPAKPAAPPWEAVSLAGGSTADPGAAGPGGGVTGSSQAAAAPEARSAEAAPERAAARADDDFGPLDEPPYDPEFDGHIEDTGPRGPASRGPAARGSATRSPAPSAAMTGRPVSPAPSGSAQGSAGSASSGVAGVDSAQAGRPGGKAGSVQGGPGLASVGGAGAAQVAEPRNGRAAAAQVAARAANRSGQRAVAPRAQQAPAKPAGQPAPNSGPEPGFDPGDEPTDEVLDASTARQSVEQQAIDSLRQRFGLVEKIADM